MAYPWPYTLPPTFQQQPQPTQPLVSLSTTTSTTTTTYYDCTCSTTRPLTAHLPTQHHLSTLSTNYTPSTTHAFLTSASATLPSRTFSSTTPVLHPTIHKPTFDAPSTTSTATFTTYHNADRSITHCWTNPSPVVIPPHTPAHATSDTTQTGVTSVQPPQPLTSEQSNPPATPTPTVHSARTTRPTPSIAPTLSTTRGIWRDPHCSPPRAQERHSYSAFPSISDTTASQATSRPRSRTRSPLPRLRRSSLSSSQPHAATPQTLPPPPLPPHKHSHPTPPTPAPPTQATPPQPAKQPHQDTSPPRQSHQITLKPNPQVISRQTTPQRALHITIHYKHLTGPSSTQTSHLAAATIPTPHRSSPIGNLPMDQPACPLYARAAWTNVLLLCVSSSPSQFLPLYRRATPHSPEMERWHPTQWPSHISYYADHPGISIPGRCPHPSSATQRGAEHPSY